MYTSKKSIQNALQDWCAVHAVPFEEVVIFGSAALLFHELVDLCNDIDIELPQPTIDRLLPDGIVTPIEGTSFFKVSYIGHDIEHIDQTTHKPWADIDGLKICTLDRLLDDYQMFNRPKDRVKIHRIRAALTYASGFQIRKAKWRE